MKKIIVLLLSLAVNGAIEHSVQAAEIPISKARSALTKEQQEHAKYLALAISNDNADAVEEILKIAFAKDIKRDPETVINLAFELNNAVQAALLAKNSDLSEIDNEAAKKFRSFIQSIIFSSTEESLPQPSKAVKTAVKSSEQQFIEIEQFPTLVQENIAQFLRDADLGRLAKTSKKEAEVARETFRLRRQLFKQLIVYWTTGQIKSAVLQGHSGKINSIALSPDEKTLASGSDDKTVRLWEVQTGKEIKELSGHTESVLSVAFSHDGKLLASGSSDGTIRLWDMAKKEVINIFDGKTGPVLSVAFSSDGKTVESAYKNTVREGSSDANTIQSWDVQTGKNSVQIYYTSLKTSVEFAPDARSSASWDKYSPYGEISFDAFEKREFKVLKPNYKIPRDVAIRSAAFSPDGNLLAAGYLDISPFNEATIRLWNVQTGKESKVFSARYGDISSIAISFYGRLIASGYDGGNIVLWDVQKGISINVLRLEVGILAVCSLAFLRDGRLLISGYEDGTIRIWSSVPAGNGPQSK